MKKWLLSFWCKHKNLIHRIYNSNHFTECFDCGRTWPVPLILTRSSGVFARIDERMEKQQEYEELVRRAEEYQKGEI